MNHLDRSIIEKLAQIGPRLPWVADWLLNDVWRPDRYDHKNPLAFLNRGEDAVNLFEQILSAAADRTYLEFLGQPDPGKRLLPHLVHPDCAVVVFDGLSLREIPMILNLASKSGLKITRIDTSLAAIPSETLDYIDREFPCGAISASQLPSRKELKQKNISAIYSGNINQPISKTDARTSLLVWSSFPDETYNDSSARFENHFHNIHTIFETAWMNTIQQITSKKKIIITSDHGYVYWGTGMDFPRNSSELGPLNQYFGNDRFVSLNANPNPPPGDDVVIDKSRNVALIRGRVKTRSTSAASTRLYKHGGLSLMEMITPWIELET